MTTRSTHRDSNRVPVFSLGERIRKAREDAGMSQQEFADQLAVDRKTIGNWEAMRSHPRYGDLMLIASVADVSLEWLAGDLFRQPEPAATPRPRMPRRGGSTSGARAADAADNSQRSRRRAVRDPGGVALSEQLA